MFMKTKIAAVAMSALVATAGVASADSFITLQMEMMEADQVTISEVVADADGYVAVYDYAGGEYGDLLGSAPIMAGANVDVIVSFDHSVSDDVVAVIYAGEVTTPDMAVAMEEIMIDN